MNVWLASVRAGVRESRIGWERTLRLPSFGGVEDNGVLETPSTVLLVPFLLLELRGSDAYGHELKRRMGDLGFHERRLGTVYRTLRQIEGEGMVSYRDEDGYETSERRYSITEAGESYLEFWAETLVRHREEIELFSEVYERTGRGVRK